MWSAASCHAGNSAPWIDGIAHELNHGNLGASGYSATDERAASQRARSALTTRGRAGGARRVALEQGVEVVGQPVQARERRRSSSASSNSIKRGAPARLHLGVALGHQLLAALGQGAEHHAAVLVRAGPRDQALRLQALQHLGDGRRRSGRRARPGRRAERSHMPARPKSSPYWA